MEDGCAPGPIQVYQAPCHVHLVLPWFWISASWDFWESSALPEQTVGEHYIQIDQGGGNYGVRWALLGQIKAIFGPGNHLLILLSVHLLQLLIGGQFSPCRQVTNKPTTIIDVVVTMSEEFRVSICWVLSITQECECWAVLKLEIALGDCWYLVPVGIFTGDLLEIGPALPMVVMPECGHYLQALVHYESPVAFHGPRVLELVYKVREHEDRQVPQCSLVGYPPVLMYSGRVGIVIGIVFRGEMELMGSPVFHPAQHLETVTKIKTVRSVCPGLP